MKSNVTNLPITYSKASFKLHGIQCMNKCFFAAIKKHVLSAVVFFFTFSAAVKARTGPSTVMISTVVSSTY